ncbi:MAG TPA: NADH-quinone oxidoreductase subunit H [Ktedonobacterales bacterium]
MNGVLSFALAVLIYPGLLVAAVAGVVLLLVRDVARGALDGEKTTILAELRDSWRGETIVPDGVSEFALTLSSGLAMLAPALALVFLPVPGNPLVTLVGLKGDLVVEGALLLGLPLARLFVGWLTPTPLTRVAADRGARLLAGATLTLTLSLTAIAQQFNALTIVHAPVKSPSGVLIAARVLSALAFICVLPVLTRTTAIREPRDAKDAVPDELLEVTGRDRFCFRLGEAIQLAAASGLFIAVFVLPFFTAALPPAGTAILWVVGLLLTAAGVGAWDAMRGRIPAGEDHPPLTWWLGWPLLIALAALVVTAWATRGV